MIYAGSLLVLESFGKLSKLKMPFPRSWIVLKKRGFQNSYGKFWVFVWKNSRNIIKWKQLGVVLNTVYVMPVHFNICNTKRSLPKIHKYSIGNNVFPIFMVFQNAYENVFDGFGNLVVWLWKSFGNMLVFANPVCSFSY